jgi:hypothetical protein
MGRRRTAVGAAATLVAVLLTTSACTGGTASTSDRDPALAAVDVSSVAGDRSQMAFANADAASPAARGSTVAVLKTSGTGFNRIGTAIAASGDAGVSWREAPIDGQAATSDSLERLAASPRGWLAVGRAETGPRDRLVVYSSPDSAAFTRTGDGVPVPDGAEYLLAGTEDGWTVVFRKEGDPWRSATSPDGRAWTVRPVIPDGLSPEEHAKAGFTEDFLDIAASDHEIVLVGEAVFTILGQKQTYGVIYHSGDGGVTYASGRYASTARLGRGPGAPRAAAWTPEGPAMVGWGRITPGKKYPEAVFRSPVGSSALRPSLEAGLRDGVSPDGGADELDYSDGSFLVAGNQGSWPRITSSLRIGRPGAWADVRIPSPGADSHDFPAGNVGVPGGFLSFQTRHAEIGSRVSVYFIDRAGTASLRSTLAGPASSTPVIASMATGGGTVEALGYQGSQPAVFRRVAPANFGSPTLLPTRTPVVFTGLRSGAGGQLVFGQRQLANNGHGVAWTSRDGSQWNTGSEAVLSPGPEDRTVIRDGLVAQGKFFVAGAVKDRQGTVSGAVAVRGHDEEQWTRPSAAAFAGAKGTEVTVQRLAEAPDGSIVAIGTATTAGTARLKAWRSAGGSAFAEVQVPQAPAGASRAVGGLVRVGGRLALSVTDELADRTRHVAVYESSDSGATWAAAPQDALAGNEPIATDLASDGEDAVLVATVGTATQRHAVALRRAADGAWRALELDSRTLASGSTAVLDSALSGGHLVISAETGPAAAPTGAVVDIALPDRT